MSEQKPKKKRLRGFAGVINTQLSPLNSIEHFRKKFADEKFKILLNATDGKIAALIIVDHGVLEVDSVKNTPKDEIKKKKLGWKGKLETTMPIFLDIAMGKLSTGKIILKVLTRKVKIKGVSKLLKLLTMFSILEHEQKKKEAEKAD
ncbi:MAG: hypothetical protein ACTSR8_00750 [Promethearchaeota archaeon]